MHFNADPFKVSDYTYTLSSYSEQKVEFLDFTDINEIPNNYLYLIINEYIKKYEKEFNDKHKDIWFYFNNDNNNLGFYFLCIENKSNLDYFVEFSFDNKNCELIQDELIINFIINSIKQNLLIKF